METKVSYPDVGSGHAYNQALTTIADVARGSAAEFARQLKPHGLTLAALGVLDYLLRAGTEATQVDLARSTAVKQVYLALI